ncbi:hypothetical protein E2C01_022109 [Portunus trituberculatus]|uniref:Uncharacterized protein n=1 Tax=Portunus trituberculatus TaxID=210409 RepID=A0A5B7E6Q8_PORTR|nr:hypothetical protein [Portunus trituberculatus]
MRESETKILRRRASGGGRQCSCPLDSLACRRCGHSVLDTRGHPEARHARTSRSVPAPWGGDLEGGGRIAEAILISVIIVIAAHSTGVPNVWQRGGRRECKET